jgi:hypothetical protein
MKSRDRDTYANHVPYDPTSPYDDERRALDEGVRTGDPLALLQRAEERTTHHLARLHAKWLDNVALNETARTIVTIAGRQADERDHLRTTPVLDGRTAHVRCLYDHPVLGPSHGERSRRRRLQWIAEVCEGLAMHPDGPRPEPPVLPPPTEEDVRTQSEAWEFYEAKRLSLTVDAFRTKRGRLWSAD